MRQLPGILQVAGHLRRKLSLLAAHYLVKVLVKCQLHHHSLRILAGGTELLCCGQQLRLQSRHLRLRL